MNRFSPLKKPSFRLEKPWGAVTTYLLHVLLLALSGCTFEPAQPSVKFREFPELESLRIKEVEIGPVEFTTCTILRNKQKKDRSSSLLPLGFTAVVRGRYSRFHTWISKHKITEDTYGGGLFQEKPTPRYPCKGYDPDQQGRLHSRLNNWLQRSLEQSLNPGTAPDRFIRYKILENTGSKLADAIPQEVAASLRLAQSLITPLQDDLQTALTRAAYARFAYLYVQQRLLVRVKSEKSRRELVSTINSISPFTIEEVVDSYPKKDKETCNKIAFQIRHTCKAAKAASFITQEDLESFCEGPQRRSDIEESVIQYCMDDVVYRTPEYRPLIKSIELNVETEHMLCSYKTYSEKNAPPTTVYRFSWEAGPGKPINRGSEIYLNHFRAGDYEGYGAHIRPPQPLDHCRGFLREHPYPMDKTIFTNVVMAQIMQEARRQANLETDRTLSRNILNANLNELWEFVTPLWTDEFRERAEEKRRLQYEQSYRKERMGNILESMERAARRELITMVIGLYVARLRGDTRTHDGDGHIQPFQQISQEIGYDLDDHFRYNLAKLAGTCGSVTNLMYGLCEAVRAQGWITHEEEKNFCKPVDRLPTGLKGNTILGSITKHLCDTTRNNLGSTLPDRPPQQRIPVENISDWIKQCDAWLDASNSNTQEEISKSISHPTVRHCLGQAYTAYDRCINTTVNHLRCKQAGLQIFSECLSSAQHSTRH